MIQTRRVVVSEKLPYILGVIKRERFAVMLASFYSRHLCTRVYI